MWPVALRGASAPPPSLSDLTAYLTTRIVASTEMSKPTNWATASPPSLWAPRAMPIYEIERRDRAMWADDSDLGWAKEVQIAAEESAEGNGLSAWLADPSCSPPPRRRAPGGDGGGRHAAEAARGQNARLGPARCLLSDPMTWRHLRRSRTWARRCKHDAGETERRSFRELAVRTPAAEAPPGGVMPSDSFGAAPLGRFGPYVARPRLAAFRPMEPGRRCRTGGGVSTP